MTRRIIQLELVARNRAQFAREAGRLNCAAVGTAGAQHERHLSTLATAYRAGRHEPPNVVGRGRPDG